MRLIRDVVAFMPNDDVLHTSLSHRDTQVVLLHRHASLSDGAVNAFVAAIFQSIAADALHLDVTHAALTAAGLRRQHHRPSCRHHDSDVERQNILADVLLDALRGSAVLQQSLRAIVTDVLTSLTSAAPNTHLSNTEISRMQACCSPGAGDGIDEYETNSAHVAHIAVCSTCAAKLLITPAGRK